MSDGSGQATKSELALVLLNFRGNDAGRVPIHWLAATSTNEIGTKRCHDCNRGKTIR